MRLRIGRFASPQAVVFDLGRSERVSGMHGKGHIEVVCLAYLQAWLMRLAIDPMFLEAR